MRCQVTRSGRTVPDASVPLSFADANKQGHRVAKIVAWQIDSFDPPRPAQTLLGHVRKELKVLPDPKQVTAWVAQRELAHLPGMILDRTNIYAGSYPRRVPLGGILNMEVATSSIRPKIKLVHLSKMENLLAAMSNPGVTTTAEPFDLET